MEGRYRTYIGLMDLDFAPVEPKLNVPEEGSFAVVIAQFEN